MTLLDYFAGKALGSIISVMIKSDDLTQKGFELARKQGINLEDGLAKMAYNHAEAMLRERKRRLKEGK